MLLQLLLLMLTAFERMPVNGISRHNLIFMINNERCKAILTPRQSRTLTLLDAALGCDEEAKLCLRG